ncbi:MAG TPA: hypothetical protein VNH80_12330, partial [Burkholderiales bacterium]|nr:hypothetical protein [Burkholderiales bacterium]
MGQTDYSVMNIASLLFAALLGFTATAQAQSFTKPAADQSLPAPSAGKAQIVFIRATDAFIYKILSWLAEVTPEKDVLISSMQNKTKVVYETTPGEHLFMSHSPVWTHFMIANVEAGKRYYVLVRPV